MKEITRPSIIEVFDHYGIRILGRGSGWAKCECPSLGHEDMNPSASVNEDLGKFNCFSCGRSGDSLDIIMEREGLARITDAQRWAAERLAGGSGEVRGERGSGSRVPGRSGNRQGGGSFVPPWSRL